VLGLEKKMVNLVVCVLEVVGLNYFELEWFIQKYFLELELIQKFTQVLHLVCE